MSDQAILEEIDGFLACPTPEAWLDAAVRQQEVLLIDHAQCEQKAAATAMRLVYRYPEDTELTLRMSKLAREELRHFEQVVGIMRKRGLGYRKQEASRYAAGLRALVRSGEPKQLIDLLIVGAFIEARSCERFARLAPLLDDELSEFYTGLLASEGRHYRNYLKLARDRSRESLEERIERFREREGELIASADPQFRFHSGCPV